MKGNEYSIGQRMGAVRTKKKVKVQCIPSSYSFNGKLPILPIPILILSKVTSK